MLRLTAYEKDVGFIFFFYKKGKSHQIGGSRLSFRSFIHSVLSIPVPSWADEEKGKPRQRRRTMHIRIQREIDAALC